MPNALSDITILVDLTFVIRRQRPVPPAWMRQLEARLQSLAGVIRALLEWQAGYSICFESDVCWHRENGCEAMTLSFWFDWPLDGAEPAQVAHGFESDLSGLVESVRSLLAAGADCTVELKAKYSWKNPEE